MTDSIRLTQILAHQTLAHPSQATSASQQTHHEVCSPSSQHHTQSLQDDHTQEQNERLPVAKQILASTFDATSTTRRART